tara:strand:- start:3684 stop:4466 length:783 start_codon:yes stop_codon:yes gene_type:complete
MTNLDKVKFFFNKNGYIILPKFLVSEFYDKSFEKVNSEVNDEYLSNYKQIKKLGGFLTGNLDLLPSQIILDIWTEIRKSNINEIFKHIFDKNIENFDVKFAGNISIPKKGSQLYHTDGPKKSRKILIGVPIEDLNEIDGPTELIPGSHIDQIPFWQFYLTKFSKEKKKIILEKGDIFIRESHIWHKGTKNKNNKLRTVILFILSEKKNDSHLVKQNIHEKIKFGENMFQTNASGYLKEVLSVYFPIIFALIKIALSIFRR